MGVLVAQQGYVLVWGVANFPSPLQDGCSLGNHVSSTDRIAVCQNFDQIPE